MTADGTHGTQDGANMTQDGRKAHGRRDNNDIPLFYHYIDIQHWFCDCVNKYVDIVNHSSIIIMIIVHFNTVKYFKVCVLAYKEGRYKQCLQNRN